MKKVIVIFLSVIIALICVVPSFAVADNSKLTYLYLDKGNIVIGDGVVSGYGYFGEPVSTYDSDGYMITQTNTETLKNTITFDGGKNYVVFKNISANITDQFVCAVTLKDNADVTIKLEGVNTFISGSNVGSSSRAGVEVDSSSTLTIMGDGTLRAGSTGQAGIGGGNGNSSGTIIINSGTIVAQSKNYGAGIGGGSSGSNGTVIINGGNVAAAGGASGAGIGGGCTGDGGEIIINGGTVTAIGGTNGAGIGGGWYGSMGNVVINGGSVKATAGSGASKIGAGAGAVSDSVLNSYGEVLYLAKVNMSSVSSIKEIYTDGYKNNINSNHSGDTNFYFYLPADTHIIAADSDTSVTSYWKAEYSSSFVCNAVTPFTCVGTANIQPDDIVRGLSCSLNDTDDYLVASEGFYIYCEDSIVGTGSAINVVYNNNIVFSYKALIYGDLNGDGFYDGEDSLIASFMLWGHLTSENTEAFYFEAADVNRSGTVDITDIETLQQAGLLLAEVPQTNDGAIETDSIEWEEYTLLIDQTVETEAESEDDALSMNIFKFVRDFFSFIIDLINSLISFDV